MSTALKKFRYRTENKFSKGVGAILEHWNWAKMFAKAKDVNIGQSNVLSGKDVKQLVANICAQFPIFAQKEEFLIKLGLAGKSKSRVFKIKLPNRVTLFCIPKDNEDVFDAIEFDTHCAEVPIFFDTNGKGDIFPTFLALSMVPNAFRSVSIASPASKFILNGADVMLPGFVRYVEDSNDDCFGIGHFKKGDKVCVLSYKNPIPFAVGRFVLNSQDALKSEFTGKGIQILHSFGDNLWRSCFKHFPNDGFSRDLSLISPPSSNKSGSDVNSDGQATDVASNLAAASEAMSPTDLLIATFKHCLPKLAKCTFPLLASGFFADVMLPSRPKGSHLDIKKSRFKKISTFLEELEQNKVVALNNQNAVLSILSFDLANAEKFVDCKSSRNLNWKKSNEEGHQSTETTENKGRYEIITLMKPDKSVFNRNIAFKRALNDTDMNALLALEDVRGILFQYIQDASIVESADGSCIELDPVLSGLLTKKEETSLWLTKKDAMIRFEKCFVLHQKLKKPDGGVGKLFRGTLPQIEIMSKRQNNKFVTLVKNLEKFELSLKTVANEAKKSLSCSCTFDNVASNVLIQGRKESEMKHFLETHFELPTNMIRIKK